MRPRILVTGFGPFPGAPENPSERLIEQFDAGEIRLPPGVHVTTAVLPTSWVSVPSLVAELLARHQPDIALHFGFSARARGFRIERIAQNRTHARADVDGRLPRRSTVRHGARRHLISPLPVHRIVMHLRAQGLVTELSSDAGGYLCNKLFYLSLTGQGHDRHLRNALFVHIPEVSAFSRPNDLARGTEIIIRACSSHIGLSPRHG